PGDGLRVQALGWNKEDREIGRMRRLDIFVADLSGLDLEEILQRLATLLDHADIGALDRVLQAPIIFERKLAVDRQPARRAVLAASGKLDRVFHGFLPSRPSCDV